MQKQTASLTIKPFERKETLNKFFTTNLLATKTSS